MAVDPIRNSRDAWRALMRSPGLVVAAVVCLAVGIGANLTVFGVLRAIEFPILPYPDAARLVQIDASNVARGASGIPISIAEFDDVRRTNRSFAAVAVSVDATLTLREGAEPARIAVKQVSGRFFTTLGVAASLGRVYSDTDGSLTNIVVVSDRLWREQLGADRRAVGRVVRLDGESYTVLGVMPPRFDENVEAWIPLRVAPSTALGDDRVYTAIARLRRGRLLAARRQRERREPAARPRHRASPRACDSNSLGRDALAAIPAGRCRRPGTLDDAAALGAGLSLWGTNAVTGLAELPGSVHVPVDGLTVLAAMALAAIVAVIVALAPALMAAGIDADTALRESATRGASGSLPHRRLRTLLLYVEVAAACVLVTGASLMSRTLWNRQQRDLGFDPRNALRGEIAFSEQRYDDRSRLRTAVNELRGGIQGQAGVRAVAASSYAFTSGLGTPTRVTEPGRSTDILGPDAPRGIESVTPGFFAAMATPVLRGRDFRRTDATGGAPVAVVNDAFARRTWPNADAVGRSIRIDAAEPQGRDISPTVTIVGVVASTLRSSMHDRVLPRVYVAFDQFPARNVTLFVRAGDAPERLIGGVKAAARAVDPALFVEDLRTLASDEAAFLRPTRLYAVMLQSFAGLALLLAAIGVYASMAYSVAQRTREIAIRLALGADPGRLVRHVLRESVRVAIVGGVLGILVARAGGGMLRSLVYGVETTDPTSFAAATIVLLAVVVAGSWIPARRASVTDPAIALKAD